MTKVYKKRLYISTTISPSMLSAHFKPIMQIHEIQFSSAKKIIENSLSFIGNVGHQNTAQILAKLLGLDNINKDILFGRNNLSLKVGDKVMAFIPQFRTSSTKEFTTKEIEDSGFRVFYAECK